MKKCLQYIYLLTICIACGVNTGNPGTNDSGTTTMLLKIPKAQSGDQIALNITGVKLSSKSSRHEVSETVTAYSGQQVSLFSKTQVPSGTYTQVELSQIPYLFNTLIVRTGSNYLRASH